MRAAARSGIVHHRGSPASRRDVLSWTLRPPSNAEAWDIVKAIRPIFDEYVKKYEVKKYPPKVYQRVRREFRRPARVAPETLRDALLWKYGRFGNRAIPHAQESLISELQRAWSATAAALPEAPEGAFEALRRALGDKPTRFITVAFLLHLLYPRKVPIIDQHNFRAVNCYMAGQRPGWTGKRLPSDYADIALVRAFMEAVLRAWRQGAPATAPSARNLDKFLMMYGKDIK